VIRFGMTLLALVAVGAGCRGPSPRLDVASPTDELRRQRVERTGAMLLPGGGVRWRVTSRADVGAWAWPDGRIEVSRTLVDRLDDHELAAALAHELGHLFDGGHLPSAPHALAGGASDLERRADRIGCEVLVRHGIPPAAMPRMLAKVAAATRDPSGELAARVAAARGACPAPPPAP
jgi:Zn-dependent protease with chaperone function